MKLFLIIVAALALIAWFISQYFFNQPVQNIVRDALPDPVKHAVVEPSIVVEEALGLQEPPRVPAVEGISAIVDVAPVKELKLELLGTMLAGGSSSAIIQMSPEKEQRMVFVGNRLREDVLLKAIEQDAIVVDHAGKLKRFSLAWGEQEIDSTSIVPMQAKVLPRPSELKPPQVSMQLAYIKQLLNTSSDYAKFKDRYESITAKMKAGKMKTGKLKGYYAEDIFSSELISAMGLSVGDIVRRVNHIQLNSPENIHRAIQSMNEGQSLSLKVQRGEKSKHIQFGSK